MFCVVRTVCAFVEYAVVWVWFLCEFAICVSELWICSECAIFVRVCGVHMSRCYYPKTAPVCEGVWRITSIYFLNMILQLTCDIIFCRWASSIGMVWACNKKLNGLFNIRKVRSWCSPQEEHGKPKLKWFQFEIFLVFKSNSFGINYNLV